MEPNQEKFVTDYVRDMRTLYTHLEKRDKEMEASYQKEISLIQNKLSTMDEEMTIMLEILRGGVNQYFFFPLLFYQLKHIYSEHKMNNKNKCFY